MLDEKSGEVLVKAARDIVEKISKEKKRIGDQRSLDGSIERNMKKSGGEKLRMPRGVFVTIKATSGELRGCIGFIHPTPLWDAVQRAAACAAFGDFRFAPLTAKELDEVVFEVSVMTEPVLVEGSSRAEWKKKIIIGRDGLIITSGGYSGLLLPQVPVEQRWSVDEFMDNICYKAGLPEDALRDSCTKLMKFECRVFAEDAPGGKIREIRHAAALRAKK
jgi:hypothetical protein